MGSSIGRSKSFNRDLSGDLIISYIDGFVWMSWPGTESKVKVGPYESVVPAMRDFVAQCDLGERLLNGSFRRSL